MFSLTRLFKPAKLAHLSQALLFLACSQSTQAQPAVGERAPLVLFWSKPVASELNQGIPSGTVLLDMARSSSGPTVFLVSDAGRPGLLVGPNEAGPGRLINLPLPGARLRISWGAGEALWVGGVANERYAGIASGKMSDAYLAKLDQGGRILWDRTFGGHSLRTIESLASLPSGDLIVAGRDDERTWLARISGDGRVVWERFVGSGKGASIATLNNAIFLAAFEISASSTDKIFSENVGVWSFDGSGDLHFHSVIREGINRERGADFGRLLVEPANDSVYVLSAWLQFTSAKPIEITKLDLQGYVVWRKELTETLLNVPKDINLPADSGIVTWTRGVTILDHKGPTIAVPIKGEVLLLRLDRATGATTRVEAVGPDCYRSAASALFVRQISDTEAWVFGSRREDFLGTGCTWLAQASWGRRLR